MNGYILESALRTHSGLSIFIALYTLLCHISMYRQPDHTYSHILYNKLAASIPSPLLMLQDLGALSLLSNRNGFWKTTRAGGPEITRKQGKTQTKPLSRELGVFGNCSVSEGWKKRAYVNKAKRISCSFLLEQMFMFTLLVLYRSKHFFYLGWGKEEGTNRNLVP